MFNVFKTFIDESIGLVTWIYSQLGVKTPQRIQWLIPLSLTLNMCGIEFHCIKSEIFY